MDNPDGLSLFVFDIGCVHLLGVEKNCSKNRKNKKNRFHSNENTIICSKGNAC